MLYENYIYQMYNITMTSIPIMWFAIYDLEFEKDRPKGSNDDSKDSKYLLRNPILYKIGMNNECFSLNKLFVWIFYAVYHAAIVYVANLYVLMQSDAIQSDGKDIGFWSAGHSVYGSCIFIVNTLLVLRFSTHTVPGIFFFFLMYAAYFVLFSIESQFKSIHVIYGLVGNTLGSELVWLAMIFCTVTVLLPELMVKYIQIINYSAQNRKY